MRVPYQHCSKFYEKTQGNLAPFIPMSEARGFTAQSDKRRPTRHCPRSDLHRPLPDQSAGRTALPRSSRGSSCGASTPQFVYAFTIDCRCACGRILCADGNIAPGGRNRSGLGLCTSRSGRFQVAIALAHPRGQHLPALRANPPGLRAEVIVNQSRAGEGRMYSLSVAMSRPDFPTGFALVTVLGRVTS